MTLLYCGFCGKSQHEVAKLIAGPSVHICDECVALCDDIVKKRPPRLPPRYVPDSEEYGDASRLARMVCDFARHLRDHRAIRGNRVFTDLADTAATALTELQLKMATEALQAVMKKRDDPPAADIIGFGEPDDHS